MLQQQTSTRLRLNVALKLGALASALGFAAMGNATTYYVNLSGTGLGGTSWATGFPTIGQALSVATVGDQVWIKRGYFSLGATLVIPNGVAVYGGFLGGETLLSQRSLDVNSMPWIQPLYTNLSVNFSAFQMSGYHPNTRLDSVYICSAWAQMGGGVRGSNGAFTIHNCVFRNCQAKFGSACHTASALASKGGGIYIGGGADAVTITNNIFSDCLAQGSTTNNSGAGIYLGGPGIYNVANNSFVNDQVLNYFISPINQGGGMYAESGVTVNLINNSFGKCFAPTGPAIKSLSALNMRNNIFSQCVDFYYGGTPAAVSSIAGTASANNCYWGNTSNVAGFATGGTDTFTDPKMTIIGIGWVNSSHVSDITSLSPCVNSGNNTPVMGTIDILHNARIYGPLVDRGAMEARYSRYGTLINVLQPAMRPSAFLPFHVVVSRSGNVIWDTQVTQDVNGGVHAEVFGEAGLTYDVTIQAPGCLAKRFPNVQLVPDATVNLTLSNPILGDINRDNAIDIGDYAILSEDFGKTEDSNDWWRWMNPSDGSAPYCSDLDGDGEVGISDYAILSSNFGRFGE